MIVPNPNEAALPSAQRLGRALLLAVAAFMAVAVSLVPSSAVAGKARYVRDPRTGNLYVIREKNLLQKVLSVPAATVNVVARQLTPKPAVSDRPEGFGYGLSPAEMQTRNGVVDKANEAVGSVARTVASVPLVTRAAAPVGYVVNGVSNRIRRMRQPTVVRRGATR